MYVPGARERVLVTGKHGEFLVLALDRSAQLAQLMTLQGCPMLIEDVPFSQLEPVKETTSPDSL